MSEFEPLALDSTEVAVVNSLIRKEERDLTLCTLQLFRWIKELANELGVAMPDLDTSHIKDDFFRHDTSRENRDSVGYSRRSVVKHLAKDLAESCDGIVRADATIRDLTCLKLRLFGDVDFPGGGADLKAIEMAKQDGAKAKR